MPQASNSKTSQLHSLLSKGERARLIPTTADSNKEARATSILLATLIAVKSFAKEVLSNIGQRVGQMTKIDCYTEVCLVKEKDTALRPDGFMALKNSKSKEWTCIFEAKIDGAELKTDQIENYLKIARNNNIDAVITLSNQPVAHPTHTPVKVSGNLVRSVSLYHISWIYLKTIAQLVLDDDQFDNIEQKYILEEFVRYMEHPSSGVKHFDKMNPEWRDICRQAISGNLLNKNSDAVASTIASWHQEAKDVCHLISGKLNRPVRIKLPRSHMNDPEKRAKEDSELLAKEFELRFSLEIPDAASSLDVAGNLRSRVLCASMTLKAPKDKKRATSRVNWVLRQLSKADPTDVYVRSNWPRKTTSIQARLENVRENPGILLRDNNALPISFDIMIIRDIAGKFSGNKKFLEELEDIVPYFYSEIGQHLSPYIPPAPAIKNEEKHKEAEVGVLSQQVQQRHEKEQN